MRAASCGQCRHQDGGAGAGSGRGDDAGAAIPPDLPGMLPEECEENVMAGGELCEDAVKNAASGGRATAATPAAS